MITVIDKFPEFEHFVKMANSKIADKFTAKQIEDVLSMPPSTVERFIKRMIKARFVKIIAGDIVDRHKVRYYKCLVKNVSVSYVE